MAIIDRKKAEQVIEEVSGWAEQTSAQLNKLAATQTQKAGYAMGASFFANHKAPSPTPAPSSPGIGMGSSSSSESQS